MGGISIWQLLIIVLLVVLVFGTKKLSSLGSDLGASIKGFKKAMGDDDKAPEKQEPVTKDAAAKDADFAAPPLTDKQQETKQEEAKRHDKEQV